MVTLTRLTLYNKKIYTRAISRLPIAHDSFPRPRLLPFRYLACDWTAVFPDSKIIFYYHRETWEKKNLRFHDNGTVTFNQEKIYIFNEEMSAGPEDDVVVVPNIPMLVNFNFSPQGGGGGGAEEKSSIN